MQERVFQALDGSFSEMLSKASSPAGRRMMQKSASVGESRSNFSQALAASSEGAGSDIVPQHKFQEVLRPLYGKVGRSTSSIGDHPDFEHLRHTENVEYHPITTLFMDIEDSSRLAIIHDLPTVYRIKNVFILAATEIIKAFDGHVHRIMGDAVMAYFGNRNDKPEQGVIDALNCAAMLMQFVKRVVIPRLNEEFPGTDFGIRIGVDHGQREDVLWSCYGYPDMCEVTATSYHVDIASKLQHAAGRNQIMIGEKLRAEFDLHDELVKVKSVIRNGRPTDETFVTPNHTDRSGNPKNYRQYLFDAECYFTLSPLAATTDGVAVSSAQVNIAPVQIKASLHHFREHHKIEDVVSCGTVVPKDHSIRFSVVPPPDGRFPCTVKFKVENHGSEARNRGGENYANHESLDLKANNVLELSQLFNWEETSYRGLHYLIAEIRSGGVITHRGRFGVYIQ